MVHTRPWVALGLMAALLLSFGCGGNDSIRDRRRAAQRDITLAPGESLDEAPAASPVGSEEAEPLVEIEDDQAPAVVREERVASGSREERVLADLREQLSMQRQEARVYVEQGDARFAELKYEEAAANYRSALDLDPGLLQARRRYNQCQLALGERNGEIRSLGQDLFAQEAVEEQARRAEIRRNLEDARVAFDAGEVDEAERLAALAVDRIELILDYDEGSKKSAYAFLEQVRRDKARRAEARRLEELAAAEDAVLQEIEREESIRRDQVQLLLRKARDFIRLKEYRKAIEVCDRILELDPANRVAKFWRADAEDQILKQRRYKLIQSRMENQRLLAQNRAEDGIPYEDVFVFPENDVWERARGRIDALAFDTFEESEAVQRIKGILDNQRVDFEFEDQPLGEVINQIRELLGINIGIDPEVNVDDISLTLTVQGLAARSALNLLLERAGLSYTFRDNILYITPEGTASGETTFRIYNVSDILNKIRNFQGPELILRGPNDTDGGETISFTAEAEEEESTLEPDTLTELIEESTGGADEWGDPNSMEYHGGNLLVTATPDMHGRLERVLENLRKDSDLFVVVEARFIDVEDAFLEDIGIDSRALGAVNNYGTPYGNVINSSRTGGNDIGFVEQGNPTQDVTLIMGQDRWAGRIQHVIDGFTGSFRRNGILSAGGGIGGLTAQQTWLQPFQINTILRAVQERSDTRQLTAPVVTAANGQRVYVSVITQRAYIADYELVSGGTGFAIIEVADPVVQTFQEGVILDVQPVISHDKKYITLDVRPTLATLIGGVISTINISLGSFTNVAFQVPIGVPELKLQQAFTSVTVPNGGTVLLGGFNSLDEGKLRSYLPILGDIPVLGILFQRRTTYSDKRSLVILLTARIVDLRGEEEKRFNPAD